jgi:hypothetical protein
LACDHMFSCPFSMKCQIRGDRRSVLQTFASLHPSHDWRRGPLPFTWSRATMVFRI